MQILLLTEDAVFANTLKTLLCSASADYHLFIKGMNSYKAAVRATSYDLLLLDCTFGTQSGYVIAKTLRSSVITTPILLFHPDTSTETRIQSLLCGIDYILPRHFDSRELFVFLEIICKKKRFLSQKQLFGNTILDTSSASLIQGVSEIPLSKTELEILHLLFQSGSHPLSKSAILTRVWGCNSCKTENNVEVYISFLRKKLKQIQSNVQIRSTRGIGYHLEIIPSQN